MSPTDPDELARRCVAAMWDGDAASRALGMRLLDVGPGRARVAMTVRDDMVNGWGMAHGGLVATLADSAFAAACNTHGTITVAAGFDVVLLESARAGDELVADAREVALRGRSGVYDVTVSRDGAVVAEFRGRSRSLGRPNPAVDGSVSGA
ncbi:hydroxyphenylacetyl-CoA thioesterase PaaI [Nocardioides marinquilinus]|uniref:Hydroxyphenylacetyl-CoA thioesterase PaaI n=1 Tax=Nocardioides marinquilinus TaxID=1210400 RepID=A0ABP9P3Z4_9ACTN